MGIPKLFGKWIRPMVKEVWARDPGQNPMLSYIPSDIDTLVIDMNGTIHTAYRQYYYGKDENVAIPIYKLLRKGNPEGKQPGEKIFNEIFNILTSLLENIVSEINPKTTVMISVDGVTGKAKMKQQKQRRHKFVGKYEHGMPDNATAVTTGTKFMMKLHEHLKSYFSVEEYRLKYPEVLIYSSYLDPGEGEHKIMEFLRNPYLRGNLRSSSKSKGRSVAKFEDDHLEIGKLAIYGLDCDLLMLGLLLPQITSDSEENVYLIREKLDEKASFSISNFRSGFPKIIDHYVDKVKREDPRNYDIPDPRDIKRTAAEDFVVFAMLLGNDFLPHPHFYDSTAEYMDVIFSQYVKNGLSLTYPNPEYVEKLEKREIVDVPKYFINFENVFRLVSSLGNADVDIVFAEFRKKLRSFKGKYSDEFLGDYLVERGYNLSGFRKTWYGNDFRKVYYTESRKIFEMEQYVKQMCDNYVKNMAWVFHYYQTGYTNQNIYYPHFHSPILSDLSQALAVYDAKTNDLGKIRKLQRTLNESLAGICPFNVDHEAIDQMFAVLPICSVKFHIPDEVKYLVTKNPLVRQNLQMTAREIRAWKKKDPEFEKLTEEEQDEIIEDLAMSNDAKVAKFKKTEKYKILTKEERDEAIRSIRENATDYESHLKSSNLPDIVRNYFCIEETEGVLQRNMFLSTVIVSSVDNIVDITNDIDRFRFYGSSENNHFGFFGAWKKEMKWIYVPSLLEIKNYGEFYEKKRKMLAETEKFLRDTPMVEIDLCQDVEDLTISPKKISGPKGKLYERGSDEEDAKPKKAGTAQDRGRKTPEEESRKDEKEQKKSPGVKARVNRIERGVAKNSQMEDSNNLPEIPAYDGRQTFGLDLGHRQLPLPDLKVKKVRMEIN